MQVLRPPEIGVVKCDEFSLVIYPPVKKYDNGKSLCLMGDTS